MRYWRRNKIYSWWRKVEQSLFNTTPNNIVLLWTFCTNKTSDDARCDAQNWTYLKSLTKNMQSSGQPSTYWVFRRLQQAHNSSIKGLILTNVSDQTLNKHCPGLYLALFLLVSGRMLNGQTPPCGCCLLFLWSVSLCSALQYSGM